MRKRDKNLERNYFCYYCNKAIANLTCLVHHTVRCAKGPKGDTAFEEFYVRYYKYKKEDFIKDYIVLKKGLMTICAEKKIPFKVLDFLAKYYKIKRTKEESRIIAIQNTKNTIRNRYGVDNPLNIPNVRANIDDNKRYAKSSIAMKKVWENKAYKENILIKIRKSIQNKYGVDNIFSLKEYQDKAKEAIVNRFGVDNISKSEYKRNLLADKKLRTLLEDVGYEAYKNRIRQITRKHISNVLESWEAYNPICYYTGERLLNTDGSHLADKLMYPTIDHKVSVLFGYLNDIPAEIIGSLKNLCVCSRKINSTKNQLTEEEFYLKKPKNIKFFKDLFI